MAGKGARVAFSLADYVFPFSRVSACVVVVLDFRFVCLIVYLLCLVIFFPFGVLQCMLSIHPSRDVGGKKGWIG